MKFLVDAQLPRRLTYLLNEAGYDAKHTLDLPLKNRTPDATIIQVATEENRVVIIKDADFRDAHLIRREPTQLLLISTGNIRNDVLLRLLHQNLQAIIRAFEIVDYVELNRSQLVLH